MLFAVGDFGMHAALNRTYVVRTNGTRIHESIDETLCVVWWKVMPARDQS